MPVPRPVFAATIMTLAALALSLATTGCSSLASAPLIGYYESGGRAMNRGDYQAAKLNYDNAIRLKPDDFYSWHDRGQARVRMNDFDGAMADINKSIEINPKYGTAYLSRGAIRGRNINLGSPAGSVPKADLDACIADFTTAAELGPHSAEAIADRARVYAFERDFARANPDIDRAVSMEPKNPDHVWLRGAIRTLQGNDAGAALDRATLLKLTPSAGEAFDRDIDKVRAAR